MCMGMSREPGVDDGALFLSLYVLSVSVMQAGVACTSYRKSYRIYGNWRQRAVDTFVACLSKTLR